MYKEEGSGAGGGGGGGDAVGWGKDSRWSR